MRQRGIANASGTLGTSKLLGVEFDQPKLTRDGEGRHDSAYSTVASQIRGRLEVGKLAAETSDEVFETFGKVLVVQASGRGVDLRLDHEPPYGSDSL